MVIPRFIQQALTGEPITVYGDGMQSRCFCYVSDLVRGMIQVAQHSHADGEVFNIGSNEEITVLDLAHLVRELTRSKSEIVFIPYDQAYRQGFEDMRRRVPDTKKIRKLTNWEPAYSLRDTLQSVIAWFQT